MKLPKNVQFIILQLEAAGYEGYAVGGCIRDSLLSKEPDDWDITTSATPMQVKKIFKHTVETGIAHGTITVLMDGIGYEVTTYRIDGEYEDCRHPKEVLFTSNLLEDLKRRDFTINAMAYNEKTGIIDEFGGMEDLQKGIIRCVGNPKERFMEDALRMMRAVRFSAQLGYQIEENTERAIIELCDNLKHISVERINIELTKLLVSNHPDYLLDAYQLGITKIILPEFDTLMNLEQNNPHHCYCVGKHILKSLGFVKCDKVLRYTMLFHDFGKAITRTTDSKGIDHFYGHTNESVKLANTIMKRLRFDNDTRSRVEKLVKYHDIKIAANASAVRHAIVTLGEELFPLLLQVKRADFMAQSHYKRDEKEKELDTITKIYQKIIEDGDCISMKTLAVTGADLIQMGMKPGKQIGEKLSELFEIVLENPKKNTKTDLLKQIR